MSHPDHPTIQVDPPKETLHGRARILIHAPRPDDIGGIAHLYRDLAPHLSGAVEFAYAQPIANGESSIQKLRRIAGDYVDFRRRLRETRPDVVVLNPPFRRRSLIRECGYPRLARARGARTIVFHHGWDPESVRLIETRRRWRWMMHRTYFRADMILVLASQFRDDLRAMGYQGSVEVVTTAAAEDLLRTDLSPQADNADEFRLLFLSRLDELKGIFILLEAYATLKPRCPRLTLHIAGTGDALPAARSFVEKHGLADVTFLGHVSGDSKRAALHGADAFVLPSYTEGMPVAVLEAMAAGLPVLTRNVGGLPDFFDAENMGFITDSLAPEVFADAIRELIEDSPRRVRIGRFNRDYAEQHFLTPAVARRFLDICAAVQEGAEPSDEEAIAPLRQAG